jgi:hypothetical protein
MYVTACSVREKLVLVSKKKKKTEKCGGATGNLATMTADALVGK